MLHVACASSHVLQRHLEVSKALVEVLVVELGVGEVRHYADAALERAEETAVIAGGLMVRMVATSSGLGYLLDPVRREVANCLRRVVHLATLECWQLHKGPDLTKS